MTFSPIGVEQETALDRVNEWMKDPSSQIFYLGGYAGTGKTELAKHFATGVRGRVCFGAYTGKAVLVLIQRGCHDARTIHSWLYTCIGRSGEKLKQLEQALADLRARENASPIDIESLEEAIAEEQKKLDQPAFARNEGSELSEASLVILDECSMIDRRMAEDLMATCRKILVLGDPAQLPPVKGTGFFTQRKPNYLLTKVVRHDNGILDVATRVREGDMDLPFGTINEDVVKLDKHELSFVEYKSADQIMTGRNKARLNLNRVLRRLHGRNGTYPVAGDRVICLRNNRDHGLINGQIATVAVDANQIEQDCVVFSLEDHFIAGTGDEEPSPLSVYTGHFRLYQEPTLRLMSYWDRREFDEFDYGYAITVHKAQGSQWGHPWLCDDQFFTWDMKQRRRWLYTAVTRATDKLTIVA